MAPLCPDQPGAAKPQCRVSQGHVKLQALSHSPALPTVSHKRRFVRRKDLGGRGYSLGIVVPHSWFEASPTAAQPWSALL